MCSYSDSQKLSGGKWVIERRKTPASNTFCRKNTDYLVETCPWTLFFLFHAMWIVVVSFCIEIIFKLSNKKNCMYCTIMMAFLEKPACFVSSVFFWCNMFKNDYYCVNLGLSYRQLLQRYSVYIYNKKTHPIFDRLLQQFTNSLFRQHLRNKIYFLH